MLVLCRAGTMGAPAAIAQVGKTSLRPCAPEGKEAGIMHTVRLPTPAYKQKTITTCCDGYIESLAWKIERSQSRLMLRFVAQQPRHQAGGRAGSFVRKTERRKGRGVLEGLAPR